MKTDVSLFIVILGHRQNTKSNTYLPDAFKEFIFSSFYYKNKPVLCRKQCPVVPECPSQIHQFFLLTFMDIPDSHSAVMAGAQLRRSILYFVLLKMMAELETWALLADFRLTVRL